MATTKRSHELLIARKALPFETAIQRWMLRRARDEADRQIKSLVQRKGEWAIAKSLWQPVRKAAPIDKELRDIILRFGAARAMDASVTATNIRGLNRIIDPQRLRNELTSKEFRLKVFTALGEDKWTAERVRDISESTKRMVRHHIMRLLRDAARETPQPSMGEMARRIRRAYHGEDIEGRIYAWSPERAQLIARTELNMAENTGAFRGYELIDRMSKGTKWKPMKRWLSHNDATRAGDRRHDKLNRVTIDMDKFFITPLGNKMLHPGDMEHAPIKELANCGCAIRVVMVKRSQ
jgi:hypothetical protein